VNELLLVAALAAGDPAAGEALYSRCLGCHAVEYNRTGPKHCGIIGRRAGSVPGYEYSAAMKKSGIVWNRKTLERFLADPTKTVPGTTMTYAGVPDAKERADLIAYLGKEDCN
jgi:cytochrome c